MQPATATAPHHHQCGPHCTVEALFGNAYRCVTSGLVHICDRNCDQRVPYDRYSTICVVSKRLGPPMGGGLGMMDGVADGSSAGGAPRKRSIGGGGDDVGCGGDDALQMQMMMMQQQQQQQHQQHQEHLLMMQRQGSSKRGRVSGSHENGDDAAFVAAP